MNPLSCLYFINFAPPWLYLHLHFVYAYDTVSQLVYKKLYSPAFSFLYMELKSLVSKMEMGSDGILCYFTLMHSILRLHSIVNAIYINLQYTMALPCLKQGYHIYFGG